MAVCTSLDSFSHCNLISLQKCLDKFWLQVDLACKTENFVLFKEILIPNLLALVNTGQLFHREEFTQHLRQLLVHLVHLFYSNCDSNQSWLIHLCATQLKKAIVHCSNGETLFPNGQEQTNFELICDKSYSQLYSICANQLLHSAVKCEELIELFQSLPNLNVSSEKDEHIQGIVVKLKNSLFQCSTFTSFVINVFSKCYNQLHNQLDSSKLNPFDKIYLQALIHTLKNENKQVMIEILLRCPDSVLLDDNLLCQIIEYFLSDNSSKKQTQAYDDLLNLYGSCLYRFTPQLITSVNSNRFSNLKYRTSFFNAESAHFFKLKECFQLAVCENQHFLAQFRKVYCSQKKSLDISRLPVKAQIVIIIISMYDLINSNQNDANIFIEKISRFESSVSKLLLKYECDNLEEEKDRTFSRVVEKLRFVLNFADWCHTHINPNNLDSNNFCYNIIVSLLSGNSPLKILSNHGFLELKLTNSSLNLTNEVACDEICTLISQFDEHEAMLLKGFVVLRLIFFCILTKDDENVYFDSNHIKTLIQDIMPIEFRIEILENIFCLLFLTKSDFNHHLNLNSSEDEDYLDETLSSVRQSSILLESTSKLARRRIISDLSKTTCFLCPNWIIPKILGVLKDILYKTSSDIYSISHNRETADSSDIEHGLSPAMGETDFEECKVRITTLLKNVGDAHFRYDVIRPAFYKNISAIQSKCKEGRPEGVEVDVEDASPIDLNRDLISTASSDTDQKNQGQLSTSLISCMLASYTQLLCYTLIENSLENSIKIARLFQDDLKNSKELKELQLLEYYSELHAKIGNIHSTFSDTSSTLGRMLSEESSKFKIGEIANLGIRASKIQSLIYEMLLKMDKVDNVTKKVFMIDYALCSSPSLEISQAILESIFVHNSSLLYQNNIAGKVFPEKVDLFLMNFQRMISDLAHSINTSQLSISDFLKKSISFSPTLDANAFVSRLHFESDLRQAYCQFDSHLNYIETRIIDEPSLLSSDNSKADVHFRKDSQLLLSLFDKVAEQCPAGQYFYLNTLLLYVKKVSTALVECKKRNLQANKDGNIFDSSLIYSASYFSILKQSPSAILCSMVIKSKVSPKVIDDLALIMKVNLCSVLCSVYCPSISTCFLLDCTLHFFVSELVNPCLFELIEFYSKQGDFFADRSIQSTFVSNFFAEEANSSFADSSFDQSFQPLINNEVLNYFNSKCSVLVELLRILNLINDSQMASLSSQPSINMHISSQSPLLRWVERIKGHFFYGDATSTISLAFHPRIVSGHPAVIKTLEYCAANGKYKQVYELFRFIDDLTTVTADGEESNSYQLLQNAIYSRLAFIEKNAKFVFQLVRDPNMKASLVTRLLDYSENYDETFMATRLIRLCLQSIHEDETTFAIDASESRRKLEKLLKEIEFYASVGQLTGLKTWKLSKDNLESIDILTIIKTKKRFLLAIDWYKIKGLEKETCDLHIELLIHAYSEVNDYHSLRKLFHSLIDEMQSTDVISIVEKTLNLVDNLELRSFLVDLLATYYRKRMNYSLVEGYEQYMLGIEMVKLLSGKIRPDYLKLAPTPMLLLEQLLMNCEIDSLERIINQCKLIRADDLVERYAQKSVYIEIYDSHPSFHGSELTLVSSSLNDSSSGTNRSNLFTVPDKVPSKEQWVSDTSETHCMICHLVRFSMINRRHHCRRCGRVVCQACSPNSFLIAEINANAPVRVCNDCYLHLKQNTRKASTHSSNSSTCSIANRRTAWYLHPGEDVANESRRFEFSYESAPSVTLCLAILHLHSDKKRCCKFIIDKVCAPLLESTDSRYVDSTLLIEMIRSLLMSTRISIEEYLSQENRQERMQEIEQLNLYLDRLDVIRMMINSNYGTKEMIGYVLSNNIQKLQEKLLEMERFELAIDIAKKYGQDSSSIWKTWAVICLKHLQFVDARRKFSRYFDQVTRSSEVQQTLRNIVDILVRGNSVSQQPVSIKEKCTQIMAGQFEFLCDQASLLQTQASSQVNSALLQNGSHLNARIFQETVYYLKQYGSPEDLLHFYVTHLYWKEAVEYFTALNRESPAESTTCNTFLSDLFLAAQVKGALGALFAAIRQVDPQFALLWSSLITTCKYLAKNEFYNSLYRVQIFMQDYLRAAITQINCFFLSQSHDDTANMPAGIDVNSFELLHRRVNHLEKARDNCNMYLHNIEYINLKPGCLHVEKKGVLKQIRLIETQIEILKRFKLKKVSYPLTSLLRGDDEQPTDQSLSGRLLRAFQGELSITLTKLPYPPTLLEHDVVRKSQITALIILYFCDNLEEGFRYSLRIIQDHQLDARLVFKLTSVFLVAHQLEANSSCAQILELLGQLLVYVRSSLATEQEAHQLGNTTGADPESGPFSSPFTARSNSHLSRHLSLVQATVEPEPSEAGSVSGAMSGDSSERLERMNRQCDDMVTGCIGALKLVLDSRRQMAMEPSSGIARAKLSELSEALIKLLSDDKLRIEAYLHAGKLKLAYLLAVSLGQRANVIQVLDTARHANDQHYVKICEMWLRKNAASK